jgi:hypothetical protein
LRDIDGGQIGNGRLTAAAGIVRPGILEAYIEKAMTLAAVLSAIERRDGRAF